MYQFFTKTEAAANTSRAMECRNHPKNAVSPKNHRSRGNIIQRTFLFFAACCVSVASTFAQDVITLKSGEEIQALVQEIGDIDVKYKKFDNRNGPTYSLKKSDIFMIRYANGSKDVFTETPEPPITDPKGAQNQAKIQLEPLSLNGIHVMSSYGVRLSQNEVRNTMKNVPAALGQYNSGCSLRGVGWGFFIPMCIFLGAGSVTMTISNGSAGLGLYGASLGCFVPSLCFFLSGNANIKNSVSTYNRGIKQKQISDVSLNFGITQSGGIGLILNF